MRGLQRQAPGVAGGAGRGEIKAQVRSRSAEEALCTMPRSATGQFHATGQHRLEHPNDVGADLAQLCPRVERKTRFREVPVAHQRSAKCLICMRRLGSYCSLDGTKKGGRILLIPFVEKIVCIGMG